MKTGDVTDTLDLALQACDQTTVLHKPRLLSDNGSSYVSGDLAKWLEDQQMDHVRGAPYPPQTQGKIERWLRRPPQSPALSREPAKPHTR